MDVFLISFCTGLYTLVQVHDLSKLFPLFRPWCSASGPPPPDFLATGYTPRFFLLISNLYASHASLFCFFFLLCTFCFNSPGFPLPVPCVPSVLYQLHPFLFFFVSTFIEVFSPTWILFADLPWPGSRPSTFVLSL